MEEAREPLVSPLPHFFPQLNLKKHETSVARMRKPRSETILTPARANRYSDDFDLEGATRPPELTGISTAPSCLSGSPR